MINDYSILKFLKNQPTKSFESSEEMESLELNSMMGNSQHSEIDNEEDEEMEDEDDQNEVDEDDDDEMMDQHPRMEMNHYMDKIRNPIRFQNKIGIKSTHSRLHCAIETLINNLKSVNDKSKTSNIVPTMIVLKNFDHYSQVGKEMLFNTFEKCLENEKSQNVRFAILRTDVSPSSASKPSPSSSSNSDRSTYTALPKLKVGLSILSFGNTRSEQSENQRDLVRLNLRFPVPLAASAGGANEKSRISAQNTLLATDYQYSHLRDNLHLFNAICRERELHLAPSFLIPTDKELNSNVYKTDGIDLISEKSVDKSKQLPRWRDIPLILQIKETTKFFMEDALNFEQMDDIVNLIAGQLMAKRVKNVKDEKSLKINVVTEEHLCKALQLVQNCVKARSVASGFNSSSLDDSKSLTQQKSFLKLQEIKKSLNKNEEVLFRCIVRPGN